MAMKMDGTGTAIPVLRIKSNLTPVSYSTTTQSSAVSGNSVCRVVATTACHLEVGANPTATTNSMYLPAGVVDYILVPDGQIIAAIQNASAGILYVTVLE